MEKKSISLFGNAPEKWEENILILMYIAVKSAIHRNAT